VLSLGGIRVAIKKIPALWKLMYKNSIAERKKMRNEMRNELEQPVNVNRIFEHRDLLEDLNRCLSISEKLQSIHGVIKRKYDFIDRVAVTSYDPKTDLLKTFAGSGIDQPLTNYSFPLSQISSLSESLRLGRPRVINDLWVYYRGEQEHTRKIREQGYGASYTIPMYTAVAASPKRCFRPSIYTVTLYRASSQTRWGLSRSCWPL
jgi:hypothetical protein